MNKIILILSVILFSFCVNAQHTIVLKSGEKMGGEVKSLENGKITFLFKGNAMNFTIAEIESIQFTEKSKPEIKAMETTSGMKGVSYVLEGRKLVKPPACENLTMKKGIVVVLITVDKYGHVKKAEPGVEGTTTADNYLLSLAQQGAEKAMFDNCPKCPLEMKGTLTITF